MLVSSIWEDGELCRVWKKRTCVFCDAMNAVFVKYVEKKFQVYFLFSLNKTVRIKDTMRIGSRSLVGDYETGLQ